MDWFRHYHGLCTDPKLHKIARTAKVSRGLVIAAWCAILETASQAENRGDVREVDETTLSFMIDVKPGVASRILEAIIGAGLIADGYVSSWQKRQKVSDDVQKRVQRHRDQKNKSLKNNETEPNGNVTKNTEQIRTEQIRKKEEDSPAKPGADYAFSGKVVRLPAERLRPVAKGISPR